jgi:UDP-glucuronate decarboxylase
VLELATRCNARVLQASTSEVYGDPEIHPQREGYWGNVNCTGRRSCYDEGKRCAESLFFDFHRTRGTRIKVVRIFNTYGPQMSPEDGRVVSNFIMQSLAGKPLSIYGDGSQTRSFCYCADLIRGLMAMMESELDFIGPVNLGNPGEFTIAELAHLVQEMTGSNSGIIHLPIPENDPKLRRPDISLAREKLGWQPEIPLRQGLAATIEYFRSLSAGAANP